MKRRAFVLGSVGVAAGAGAATLWLGYGRERTAGEGTIPGTAPLDESGRPVFPEGHRRNLEAACVRLVPVMPDGSDARRVGAWSYIERQMLDPRLQGGRRLLMRGAVQLDKVSFAEVGKLFHLAAPEEQDQVLTAMANGAGRVALFEPRDFFEFMLAMTMEGLFGDPSHGGNRDGSGWASIGWTMMPPHPGSHGCGGAGGACQ